MEDSMPKGASDINVLELLLKISNDVSSIKTDINNLKDTQSKDRMDISKEIALVKEESRKEIKTVENTIMARITSLQSVQNTLVGEIDTLKHQEEKKDAQRWRTVVAFVLTAVGGMVVGKLPEIVSYIAVVGRLKELGGN